MRAIFRNIFFFCLWILSASGAEVSGHVQVISAVGKTPSTVVVYAEAIGERSPLKPGHFQMMQHNKTFVPHVLAVPVGSTISFPNGDPIFHNVFSLSPIAPFDLGLYRAGSSKSLVFNEPAVYRVFCNIHPQMTALLLVLPTSWITEADEQGAFRLDLPPGHYRLTAWSERSSPVSLPVVVESGPTTLPEVTLDESNYVETQHKNKYGQDYPAAAYEQLKH
jgi:plastocyanin